VETEDGLMHVGLGDGVVGAEDFGAGFEFFGVCCEGEVEEGQD